MRLSAGENKNDRLTAYDGTAITYDDIGNPITIGNATLEWEGRELKKYTPSIMDEYTYTYNADGIRTGKNLSGSVVQYVLDGSRIVSEQRDSSRIFIYLYDEAGSPIGIKYRANNFAAGVYRYYFFEKNLQGDIIAIYTEDGTKICTYTYDAWGNVTTTLTSGTSGHEVYVSNNNPFRYRGYYYDTETGWYYLQSRYYNPTWGRFINADSALNDDILGANMYAYCGNNPVIRQDDKGEAWWIPACAIVGAVVGVASKIVTNLVTQQKWNEGIIGAAASGAIYGAIVSSTGNIVAAGFASAAVEAVVNEVASYTPYVSDINGTPQKELTKENVVASLKNAANDTAVNGVLNVATGAIAASAVPTNNNWFTPKHFVSSFFGSYARKSAAQTLIQAGLTSLINTGVHYGSDTEQDTSVMIYP